MTSKEEKYLKEKLSLMHAAVLGSLWGMSMWPPTKDTMAERSRVTANRVMELLEKDVRQIYKYGKRNGRSQ